MANELEDETRHLGEEECYLRFSLLFTIKKKKEKEKRVQFKIDFKIAYNHVECYILNNVLERKGFGVMWRSLMYGCLLTTNVPILINGCAKEWIKASRGLRLGD